MARVKVIVLRAAGTNCDEETAFAFEWVGAQAELVHINRLLRGERRLADYQILAVPGGFTYGDDISAGRILANEMRFKLGEEVERFIQDGKLVLGICNGFQALAKASLLPGLWGRLAEQEATLFYNDSGRFQCQWVRLKAVDNGKCIFTRRIEHPIELPIAHGEGKFVARDPSLLQSLWEGRQVVFQYVDADGNPTPEANPNGSMDNIAGLCDPTGRILALMPHPERHIHPTQHPRWTREGLKREGDGLIIFRNAVEYAAQL